MHGNNPLHEKYCAWKYNIQHEKHILHEKTISVPFKSKKQMCWIMFDSSAVFYSTRQSFRYIQEMPQQCTAVGVDWGGGQLAN